ncbi:hypothetical protein [Yersinia ruckeri]|uniref:hypothetical protein n=1 Tax=Yersinia ruckeri TaxID=29486 RepID=UPI000536E29A|nr:hypothetical protein [Yersinia ruckeri]AUQ43828.1 hypothetical protein NJ56_17810 [Yersinia ruckeri]
MRTKSQAEKKSQIDRLKYIPMPIMCHIDDRIFVAETLSMLHERYRERIAGLYTKVFLVNLHDHKISDLKRLGHARQKANQWILEFINGIIENNS